MVKLIGKIKLDDTGLRIMVSPDICRYYIWLISRYYYNTIRLDAPKHSAHISIITSKLHGERFNINQLLPYNGKVVEIEYNPVDLRTGGRGFTNFWFPIEFPLGLKIKQELGITETNFLGYHITLCNTKGYDDYRKFLTKV